MAMDARIFGAVTRFDFVSPRLKQSIASSPDDAIEYARFTLEKRWPEVEPIMWKSRRTNTLIRYIDTFVVDDEDTTGTFYPEFEQWLVSDQSNKSPVFLVQYIQYVRYGTPWPEAIPIIASHSFSPRSLCCCFCAVVLLCAGLACEVQTVCNNV